MKKNKKQIQNLIDFHKKAEKLKNTTRHSWVANSYRQESVAEHSWMLCLLAMLLSDKLEKKINLLKVMKMVTIHDLAESVTGDIPAGEVSVRQQNKYKAEKKAFKNIVTGLPKEKSKEIIALWDEFEKNETKEAKFANSLDKIEAEMQHNLHINKWVQQDFDVTPYYKDHLFNFDPFIRDLKDVVNIQLMKNLIGAKMKSKIKPEHLERYKKKK